MTAEGPPTTVVLRLQTASTTVCCIGHIASRGKFGFEAFSVDDISLGVFSTTKGAADAISAKVVS